MKPMRLDKYLAHARGLTRSEAKKYLKKQRVTVNGTYALRPEIKVDPDRDVVAVDGQACRYEENVYLMLHKPAGVVSATADGRERTVLDLIHEPARGLFPVGRLDKDTEGLLLLTNDGALAHDLLSPGKHVDKCYYALLDEPVGEKERKMFAEGLDIGDEKPTLPAKLWPAREKTGMSEESFGKADAGWQSSGGYGVYIVIQEGRFHQVKRMAEAVGRRVLYLKRISMGSLRLDEDLRPGEYRPLKEEEIQALKQRRGGQDIGEAYLHDRVQRDGYVLKDKSGAAADRPLTDGGKHGESEWLFADK